MVCWLPHHLIRTGAVILTYRNSWSPFWETVHKYLYHVSGAFYFFNSITNPFLYTLLSKTYYNRVQKFWEKLKTYMTLNLGASATLFNVQNINMRSFLPQKSSTTANFTILYRNGEDRVSFGQISRISKESRIIRSTEV